jgi:hypothetical protein
MFTIEKTCKITKYDEGECEDLDIPEYIDGCRVVALSDGLFANRKFNNVILPHSLISMEEAFMATEITGKLTLSSTVISPNSFWMCILGSELVLPECLVSIGESAFYGCTFAGNLLIPKNVRIIEEGAFMKCCGITSIEFASGSKIQKICKYAFAGCENLRGIIRFPDFLEEIGDRAFFDSDIAPVIHRNTRVHIGAFDIF